ncbi:MAG: hypothetical protein CL840_08875 [Crocinitomicaceae bacterium]|nr:hypothetical protein [Crocinitomicaceae bacterium]|tara:strand:+ start:69056 stop:71659 length:2604 start_codon:yes stop_codon:yes gene_type:complete
MQTKSPQLILLVLAMVGTQLLYGQTKIDRSFTFQSVNKKYSIFVPANYNSSKPNKMMVGMHPFNTSRWDAKSWRDTLTTFANSNNLLLVCPDGGANGSIIDQIDTAFTTVLIDSMFKWYNVDTGQVYIMGFSFGGKATYIYGLEHPEIFAGYMPIGAATNINDLPRRRRNNAACKPVAIVHGGNDSPNSRFTPMRDTLKNYTDYVWDTLMLGVGHTIDFTNRNQILTRAFNYLDSINNLDVSVSLGKDIVQCGSDSVNLGNNLKVSGGSCTYTYAWSRSTGLNDSTLANPTASVSSNTSYILKVTDSEGKSAMDTIQVITRTLPKVSVGKDDTLCPNAGKVFVASGAKDYKWSPAAGLSCSTCSSPSIKITGTSTYYVTGTDSFGCKASDTLNLGVYVAPQIKSSNDTSICLGDTIQFNTTGGVTYRWRSLKDLSDSTIGNPYVFPKAGNFYVVTGIDSNGCSGSDFVQVSVNKNPIIKVTSDTTICFGTKVTLSATGGINYNWSGSTYLGCTNCQATTFTGKVFSHFPYKILVEGVDNNKCRGYDTVSVTVRRPVSINTSGNDTICFGESSQMVVRAGGKIKWLNSSTLDCDTCISPRATPLSTTTYPVVVTDVYNCRDTAEVTIAIKPLPTTSFLGDTLLCKGDTGKILLTSTGTITWLTTAFLDDPTSLAPKIWPNESRHFVLNSTSLDNCTSRDSVFVEVQNPTASFTVNGSGFIKTFDHSASSNYDKYTYDFGTTPGTAGTDSFTFSENGTYTVCLTVSTDEGCSNKTCESVEITTVGLQDLNGSDSKIVVFPNPTSDKFQLKVDGKDITSLRIFNLQGKEVYHSPAQTEYDISELPQGNYVIELEGDEGIIRLSLIKHDIR